uniref:Integrin beta n=1 Tax=Eptatretus burgeri TaxID=7764 RepID=A0A8C4QN49_EPTBU
ECLLANVRSCGECILVGRHCAWCTLLNFTGPGEPTSVRCDLEERLRERGCPESRLERPKGLTRIDLRPEHIVQLFPQQITLKLRAGEPQTFEIRFRRADDYPIDLYYLMDLSYSMKDDLENVKKLGTELQRRMEDVTSDFRIGFGAFVDKTVMPYVSTVPGKLRNPCGVQEEICSRPFGFRNVLPLTAQSDRFNRLVGRQRVSGNLDSPEGGFDAIMQVASLGLSLSHRRLVGGLSVFYSLPSSVAPPALSAICPNHISAGCSRSANNPLLVKLPKSRITAHLHSFIPLFSRLWNKLPQSIQSHSSLQPFKTAALSSELVLENSKPPEGVSMTYTAYCKHGQVFTGEAGRRCLNIQIGDEVKFHVKVQTRGCPANGNDIVMEIRPLGFDERLWLRLQFVCLCKCQQSSKLGSPDCHFGNGSMECGACRCNEGRLGRECECSSDAVPSTDMDASCRPDNSSEMVCSGRGDCLCGECVCHGRENLGELLYGKYCECDNFSCDRTAGIMCGGNGVCDCSHCKCFDNFTGAACDCPVATDGCQSLDGEICSNRGTCVCGVCQCLDSKYQGPTCELCPMCPEVCQEHKDCVQCHMLKSDSQQVECNSCVVSVHHVPELDSLASCRVQDVQNCWIIFSFVGNGRNTTIVVQEKRECPAEPDVAAIVVGVVTGIVLAGLLLLLGWKLLTTLHDRREVAKFEKEKLTAKWDAVINTAQYKHVFRDTNTCTHSWVASLYHHFGGTRWC